MQVTDPKLPTEVMPFEWDIKIAPVVVSAEDKEELMRMAVDRAALIPKG